MSNNTRDDDVVVAYESASTQPASKGSITQKEIAEKLADALRSDPELLKILKSEGFKNAVSRSIYPRSCGDTTPIDFNKGVYENACLDSYALVDGEDDELNIITFEIGINDVDAVLCSGMFSALHPSAVIHGLVGYANYINDLSLYGAAFLRTPLCPINVLSWKMAALITGDENDIRRSLKYTIRITDSHYSFDDGLSRAVKSGLTILKALRTYAIPAVYDGAVNRYWRLNDPDRCGLEFPLSWEQLLQINHALAEQNSAHFVNKIMGNKLIVSTNIDAIFSEPRMLTYRQRRYHWGDFSQRNIHLEVGKATRVPLFTSDQFKEPYYSPEAERIQRLNELVTVDITRHV